jgi:hypothetical protein
MASFVDNPENDTSQLIRLGMQGGSHVLESDEKI